jgi:hypothetical protein
MLREGAWSLLLVVAAASLGCGGGDDLSKFKEGLVPVTGTVTLDGEPLEGAGVLFMPASAAGIASKATVGSRTAFGETDALGMFSLMSPPHGPGVNREEYPGCLPGEYIVVFDRRLMPDGSKPDPGAAEPQAMRAEQTIPAKYISPQSSGIKATVTEAGGNFSFDLESKSKK